MIPKSAIDRLVLSDLRLFVKAAQLLGLGAAGAALGIPRASASRQLQRLESVLGVRLIQREGRHFILTEEGQAFLPLLRTALADLDEATSVLRGGSDELAGLLRISAPYSFGRIVLAPIVTSFAKLHPKLAISVDLGSRHVNLLTDEADVAIRIGAIGATDVIARCLGSETMILVASPDYLDAMPPVEKAEDLLDHRLLDYRLDGPSRELELFAEQESRTVRIQPVFRSNEPSLVVGAALEGLGIAIAPLLLSRESLESGALVRVLPDWCSLQLDVSALYAPGRGRSPKIRAFLDYAAERIG